MALKTFEILWPIVMNIFILP